MLFFNALLIYCRDKDIYKEDKMGELNLKILLVEDEDIHAKLTDRELRKFTKSIFINRIEDGETCIETLKENSNYDLILLDYSLPKFNGLEIMRQIIQLNLQIPIILVTGHGNESVAVEAMKLGASDYIIKTEDYFSRIPYVVSDCVEKARLRKEKSLLEAKLKESEEKFRNLFLASTDSIIILDNQYRISSFNPATESILGYSKGALGKLFLKDLLLDKKSLDEIADTLRDQKGIANLELILKAKGGENKTTLASFFDIRNDKQQIIGMGCVFKDITERKRDEERIKALLDETQKKSEELAKLNKMLEEYITGKRSPS